MSFRITSGAEDGGNQGRPSCPERPSVAPPYRPLALKLLSDTPHMCSEIAAAFAKSWRE
jgi:hypothetical protein